MEVKLVTTLHKNFEEHEPSDHFVDINKMIKLTKRAERKISDYLLTRYACYLIAQNGDPQKDEIAFAMKQNTV